MKENQTENHESPEVDILKDQLIARLSHEIRTPLNAIMGFTEQLFKTALSPQQTEYLKVIDKSSLFLFDLVNNILQFSKLDSSSIHLDENDFDIEVLLKEVYKSFLPRAEDKKINLALETDKSCTGIYRGDIFKIKQILNNLINNAIKFTDYGYVGIRAKKLEENAHGKARFRLEIKDTGPGIPKDKQAEIFLEYRQVSTGISRTHGGAGLGLTISRRLLRAMNGEITLKSAPGKGSEFIVELPLTISPLKELTREITNIDTNMLAGVSALIVDDDAVNRLLGKIILRGFNMDADIATNGEEALRLIESGNYDILLLDIHMPVISGKEVAAFARKKLKDDIKILAVTAEVMPSELESLKTAGVDDFLIKPYQEISLFNKICKVMEIDAGVYASPVPSNRLSISQEPCYDLRNLRSVSRQQEDFFLEMINTFIENAQKGIEEIDDALERGDMNQVIETSHRLIPSYKHLEIRSVVSSLLELKNRAKEASDPRSLRNLTSRIRLETNDIIEQLSLEKP